MANRIAVHRPAHLPARQGPAHAAYDARPDRRADNRFYCSRPWRELRDAYRKAHPLCERCKAKGKVVPAEIVHHRIPRKERPDLALTRSNLEAVCSACHNTEHKAHARAATPAKGSGFELLQ